MSIIDIKMFPASYGDSFLVTCHGKIKTNILIDMGFKSTYDNSIKKELQQISKNGETISLLIFTHIDEDHILGGIKFLEENRNQEIIEVDEVWYNSLKHIKSDNKRIEKEDEICLIAEDELSKIINKGHGRELGVRAVSDISYKQGSTLAGLLYKNGYTKKWNSKYNYQAVSVKQHSGLLKTIFINDKVKITVLSPDETNLEKLYKLWEEKIRKWDGMDKIPKGLTDEAFEIYVATELDRQKKSRIINKVSGEVKSIEDIANQDFDSDTSLINGSSIAFILEFETKKILFLSDAHSETIENNLKKIQQHPDERLFFDAIKISHHGSKYNMSKSLLDLIGSKNYLISTNGMVKNHPDYETFCRIVSSNKDEKKRIIFNYKPKIYDKINKDMLKKEFNYEILYANDIKEGILNEVTNIPIK